MTADVCDLDLGMNQFVPRSFSFAGKKKAQWNNTIELSEFRPRATFTPPRRAKATSPTFGENNQSAATIRNTGANGPCERLTLTMSNSGAHSAFLATNLTSTFARLLRTHEPIISGIRTCMPLRKGRRIAIPGNSIKSRSLPFFRQRETLNFGNFWQTAQPG